MLTASFVKGPQILKGIMPVTRKRSRGGQKEDSAPSAVPESAIEAGEGIGRTIPRDTREEEQLNSSDIVGAEGTEGTHTGVSTRYIVHGVIGILV